MRKRPIIGVSGGPDSVCLLHMLLERSISPVVAHLNHRARGEESEADQRFVEKMAAGLGLPSNARRVRRSGEGRWGLSASGGTRKDTPEPFPPGFEIDARDSRYLFFEELMKKYRSRKTLLAHTADDQVETILMRVLEGAGIAGLKGIPLRTEKGIERPILYMWREDILKYLKEHKISFRVDRSNLDTRFERNWIRHVLIPLLEKRYGKSVKKRIFALGERFREIDRFLEVTARKWTVRNVRTKKIGDREGRTTGSAEGGTGKGRSGRGEGTAGPDAEFVFRRKPFCRLPSELRIRILQILCFEKGRISPNERLLASMDRILLEGGPSARLNIGKGALLACRYDEAVFRPFPVRENPDGRGGRADAGMRFHAPKGTAGIPMKGPGKYPLDVRVIRVPEGARGRVPVIDWEERMRPAPARLRTLCRGEKAAAFDSDLLDPPFSVRPLRAGDRIRPFGMGAEKKVKEILIDRKIPREERWGRPVVCDAAGKILWIPGILRSAHAPVTPETRRTVVLRSKS